MTQPVTSRLDSPVNPFVGSASKRLENSLSRLAGANAVKPTERADARADSAQVADPSSVVKALRDGAPLRTLAEQLFQLRKALSSGSESGAAPLAQAANSTIKALFAGLPDTGAAPTSRLDFDAPFLDLSGDKDDPEARFEVELSGPRGRQNFSFASGTSIQDIAETLGGFAKELGVTTTLSGNALRFDSDSPLSASFVGVRVLDAAGANLAQPTETPSALSRLSEAIDRPGALADRGFLSLLDDAIREVEQLERAQLLSRGLTPEVASFTRDDLDVIREAQLKLIQEARRVGLVSDPDPQSAIDALRG